MAHLSSRTWSRWILAWGRRRSLDNHLAPTIVPDESMHHNYTSPYPYLIYYDSPEEALAASGRRKRLKEVLLRPLAV